MKVYLPNLPPQYLKKKIKLSQNLVFEPLKQKRTDQLIEISAIL
jgi:hypothetical protein